MLKSPWTPSLIISGAVLIAVLVVMSATASPDMQTQPSPAYSNSYLATELASVSEDVKLLANEIASVKNKLSDLEFYEKPDEFQANTESLNIKKEVAGDNPIQIADASQSNVYEIYQSGGDDNVAAIYQDNTQLESSQMYTPEGGDSPDSLMNDLMRGVISNEEFQQRYQGLR